MAELFFRHGESFTGTPLLTDNGKPYIVRPRTCWRCGGAGGSDKWRHTGWTCFDCGGAGTRGTQDHKLYSAEQLAKLNASADKRRAKKAAEAQAAADKAKAEAEARSAAFFAQYGDLLERAIPYRARSEFIADIYRKAGERCELSPAQADALAAAIARIEAADAKRAASDYVGNIGERLTLKVTAERLYSFESIYGRTYIATMRDDCGNAIVSKGRFHDFPGVRWNDDRGRYEFDSAPFVIRGTVKGHDLYKDERQTRLERVAVAS